MRPVEFLAWRHPIPVAFLTTFFPNSLCLQTRYSCPRIVDNSREIVTRVSSRCTCAKHTIHDFAATVN